MLLHLVHWIGLFLGDGPHTNPHLASQSTVVSTDLSYSNTTPAALMMNFGMCSLISLRLLHTSDLAYLSTSFLHSSLELAAITVFPWLFNNSMIFPPIQPEIINIADAI
jgi:hypothetical protein